MSLIYKEVKTGLIDMIASMKPHTRIPSRLSLCKKFMVARTTVDKAIYELIHDGHLYAVNGSGTFVADFRTAEVSISQTVKNISILLPNIMDDTYPQILRGIEDVAQQKNINVVVCNTDNDLEKQRSYLRRLINSRIDGVIIVPVISQNQDNEMYQLLQEAQVPFLFCNRNVEGVDGSCVCSNDFYGGFLATRHLISQGYRHIEFLSPVTYKTSIDRYCGYLAALDSAGIPVENARMSLEGKWGGNGVTEVGGYHLMKRVLQTKPQTDAIFCFNDRIAFGATKALLEEGLKISEDMGVIGYDNTDLCKTMPVSMTSVDYRNYEIGNCAAQTLYDMIGTQKPGPNQMILFEPRLVIRNSCRGPGRSCQITEGSVENA